MRKKIREWFWRYIPLETGATSTLLLGGFLSHYLTDNHLIVAFAATWAENAGFYAVAITREVIKTSAEPVSSKMLLWHAFRIPRDLVLEFGVAEFFDGFIARPFFMYFMINHIDNLALALITGKLVADCFFYSVAIVFYEIKKRLLA